MDRESPYIGQETEYARYAPDGFSWLYIEKPVLQSHVQRILHGKPSASVLDAGCGIGRSTMALIEAGVQPQNIVGVDANSKLLEMAHAAYPELDLRQGDITKLPDLVRKDEFDLIVCNMVHMVQTDEEYAKTLDAFYEVLRSGGEFASIMTHPHHMADPAYKYFDRHEFTAATPWDTTITLHHRPMDAIINQVTYTGFTKPLFYELGVNPAGAEVDQKNYAHYTSTYSTRLMITGTK